MVHGIVTGYAEMWPREVFDIKEEKKPLDSIGEPLYKPGVYILYRDDHPYYIGRTNGELFNRIKKHAKQPTDRYYNFWNFFSAFVVPETNHIREVEGLLIAAMQLSANGAKPKITRIPLPTSVAKKLRNWWRIPSNSQ